MLAVVGTVPVPDFPLVTGQVTLNQDLIDILGYQVSVNRGTPALLAAALIVCEVLGQPAPYAYLVGDLGLGEGSRRLYQYLAANLKKAHIHTLVFHYLQPDVDWHNRVLFAVEEMSPRPILIADAGFMYAAKMSGQASCYDLFTPDVGELAFLADEQAPHPFYTRGFILHQEDRVPELIARAYAHDNAARYLLVKGQQDYLATRAGIVATVAHPLEPALEALGGTGDTLTGIVAALASTGMAIDQAAIMAARVNRFAGHYAHPTPATQVAEIIRHIPAGLAQVIGSNL
ncbi:MAG: NAD(P)H-hydrate dehydratase [Desulfobacca sp.]|nr:NAD(P)H-hydrate dehydratase [Desulfobacca sp.]